MVGHCYVYHLHVVIIALTCFCYQLRASSLPSSRGAQASSGGTASLSGKMSVLSRGNLNLSLRSTSSGSLGNSSGEASALSEEETPAVLQPSVSLLGEDKCPGDLQNTHCIPDLVVNASGSAVVAISTEADSRNLTVFFRPGVSFRALNVTLAFATFVGGFSGGTDSLSGQVWERLKAWILDGPLEDARQRFRGFVNSVDSTLTHLTMDSTTHVVPLPLNDTCQWYQLSMQAVRHERNFPLPDTWALRLWVSGTRYDHTFPTSHWYSINRLLFLEVGCQGASQWVTSRASVCPASTSGVLRKAMGGEGEEGVQGGGTQILFSREVTRSHRRWIIWVSRGR
ncbi:hypothetical protein Pcinc_042128 [Petrolisthes cinctipes]|uniref:Uncharacterized protein n=1 Tax=Petrolisthes cinctipes TaxID=88211 RepID=A0AAE1BIM3_PETCI|nr:hypothetical protein Pcinc_042128 [Petrolisthes cinctipes]